MKTVMAAVSFASPHLILRRFILRRPTPPVSHSAAAFQIKPSCLSLKFSSSLIPPRSLPPQLADDVTLLENNAHTESESESSDVDSSNASVSDDLRNSRDAVRNASQPPPPTLSIKEKKDLSSYAHSLGKKLKSQQVGKSGITDTVAMALVETLEANELLKVKIHGSCPVELDDAVQQLESATGSVAVSQIGRTVILYRPSLAKLKAEDKRKQARRIFLEKQSKSKQSFQGKRVASVPQQEPRQYGRGRRGSSRYEAD